MMKKDLERGHELFEEKFELYATERGGPESKEFANQVTIKMSQLHD